MKNSSKIDFANTLRGFAALAVIISHYFGVFWSSRDAVADLTNSAILPLEAYPVPEFFKWVHPIIIFNWGAFGVALFFLISGFVIPFSLKKSNWYGFVGGRIFRILPTYFVGFTVTLTAIFFSSWYFGREWPFQLNEIIIHYIPGVRDIFWSRSIDGIIWTLEIEMKFYFVCLLLIALFKRNSWLVFLAPLILFGLSIVINNSLLVWSSSNPRAWQLGMSYMMASQYCIFMFVGVVFNYQFSGLIDSNKAFLIISVIFCLFCIHWYIGPYKDGFVIAWSYAFALIAFIFAYSFQSFFKSNAFFDFFANISYPLYVVHGVAGYVSLRILIDKGFGNIYALVIVTLSIIFISWLMHRYIELPSQQLSKKISRLKLNSLRLGRVDESKQESPSHLHL
jgi:peptidoglycan/LPS O-acetylase OafA/YrhL